MACYITTAMLSCRALAGLCHQPSARPRCPAAAAPAASSRHFRPAAATACRPALSKAGHRRLPACKHRQEPAGTVAAAGIQRGVWLVPAAGTADEFSVEDEEEVEEDAGESPIEDLRVSAETKSKDLDSLLNQVKKRDINLQPRYQRQYIWDPHKACRLVESVFRRLFVPAVVLHTGLDGVHDVVDGKQRLTTLYCFRDGKLPDGSEFRLQGLALDPRLNGKTYKDLPDREPFPSKRHFDNYALPVTTFDESTSERAVLRVYEDLNCGSANLNKQQLRRAVYSGNYITLLEQLAKHQKFRRLMGTKTLDASERDQELILRFFALWRCTPKSFRGSMAGLLGRELKDFRHLGPEQSKRMRQLFESTLDLVMSVYGDNAFRRWNGVSYQKQLSVGLYDSVMQTFAVIANRNNSEEMKRVKVVKDRLRADLNELCLDPAFTALLKFFSAQRLKDRLAMFEGRVEDILGNFNRPFADHELLKTRLFAIQNQQCALCRHPIYDLKDAELDHRVPLAKGGDSDPSNAQLVHRECNRAKGSKVE